MPDLMHQLNKMWKDGVILGRPRSAVVPQELLQHADKLLEAGDFEGALAALATNPNVEDDDRALRLRFECRLAAGDLEGALADIDAEKAQLGLRLCSLQSNRATALAEAGRLEEAAAAAKLSLDLMPHRSSGWINYLSCLCLIGDADRLAAATQEMKRRWPDWAKDAMLRQRIDNDTVLRPLRVHGVFSKLFPEFEGPG